jgi:hypothetical protein
MVGLLYALPGTQLSRRLEAEGRLRDDAYAVGDGDADQCTSGLNYLTTRPREEILADYRAVLERIYAPASFFGRVRRACRDLDRSGRRLDVPLRHVWRDLRGIARIATRLSTRGPAVRRAFWGAMADTLVHNPRALKITASFAALYLHLGPFSRELAARLSRELAGAERAASGGGALRAVGAPAV